MLKDRGLKARLSAIARTVPAAGGLKRAAEIVEGALLLR
jgi:hypothetical protein